MADFTARFSSSYRFMRVSRATGNETERLRNIKAGGTIERNQDSSYETGSVDYTGTLDLGADLLRIYLDAEFPDGSSASEPLGTFLVSAPKLERNGAVATGTADLSGRLREIVDDEFDVPRTVSAGTNAVELGAALLREAGFDVVSDESGYALSTEWVLGVGDELGTRLKAVNALLDAAGFCSVSCDAMGRAVLRRYAEPQDRAPVMTLAEGAGARFEAAVTDELDKGRVANVVHADFSTSEESVRGTAIDDDPASEYSTVSRGWRLVATYSYDDLPEGDTAEQRQAAADSKAEELLRTQQSAVRRITLRHVYAPLSVGDAVDIRWPGAGIEGRFAVRKLVLTLVGGCPMNMEVRRYER